MEPRLRVALAWGVLAALVGAAHADPKADALFAKARQVAKNARTLQAEGVGSFQSGEQKESVTFSFRLMKPDLGEVTVKPPGGESESVLISDGKNIYNVMPSEKQYMRMPPGGRGFGSLFNFYAPIRAFFEPESLAAPPDAKLAGTKTMNGKKYQAVTFTSKTPPGPTRYFFAPNGMLEGMEIEIQEGSRAGTMTFWLKNVKLNAPMTARQFAYTPPDDFKPFDPGAGLEASLLKVGDEAPDFRLPTPDGGELSLSGLREGKKAVLINFWFYG